MTKQILQPFGPRRIKIGIFVQRANAVAAIFPPNQSKRTVIQPDKVTPWLTDNLTGSNLLGIFVFSVKSPIGKIAMSTKSSSIVSIGLTALAMPVVAQEYYLGGSFGTGNFEALGPTTALATVQVTDIFGGVRYDLGSDSFFGVEIQQSLGSGYPTSEPYLEDANNILQGELHVGYKFDSMLAYAFVGVGQSNFARTAAIDSASLITVGGIGAEIPVTDTLTLRLEAELSRLSIDDNCCGLYDPVSQQDVTVGVLYNF